MPARVLGSNRLLARLPAAETALVAPLVESITLDLGDVLANGGDRIRHAVFPTSGLISLLATVQEGPSLEIGLIGRDGMLGFQLAIGVTVSSLRAVIQGTGQGLRIDSRRFGPLLERCPILRARIHRFSYGLITRVAQTAVCNRFHSIEVRTARWMLSISDRTQSSAFELTQALLAEMLGVRRSAINQAARSLLEQGLITYARGEVRIVDRRGLEAAACSCYALSS